MHPKIPDDWEDLNKIPHDITDNFPEGVTEEIFDTKEELLAFTEGLHYASDDDVYSGESFQRDNKWVVRVKVGNF